MVKNIVILLLASTPFLGAQQKPNVLFILADDLGINALNCYGNSIVETPNIDKLYTSGMHFTNGYANDPTCAPSRAAILTGQYAPRTNIYRVVDRFKMGEKGAQSRKYMKYLPPETNHLYSKNSGLNPNNFNLAQAFKKNGYKTAAFGKWHLGKGTSGMHQMGFDEAIETKNHYDFSTEPKQTDYDAKVYNADYCTQKGINFMKKSSQEDSPFFLYMPYYLVHAPFHPKEKYVTHFKKKYKGTAYDHTKVIAVLSMIKSLDDSVGELLTALKELGIDDNTLIIFTSDNGHYKVKENNLFSLPYKGNKGDIWEGGIRVPYIFKWKDKIKQKSSSTTPIIHVDLYPTLVDLLDLSIPSHHILDGKSLKPELFDLQPTKKEKPLFWCYTNYGGFNPKTNQFTSTWENVIQYKGFKLIETVETSTYKLYNLETDPLEKKNIYDPNHDRSKKLIALLEDWKKETKLPEPQINPEYQNQ